jgi:hypothetical protein
MTELGEAAADRRRAELMGDRKLLVLAESGGWVSYGFLTEVEAREVLASQGIYPPVSSEFTEAWVEKSIEDAEVAAMKRKGRAPSLKQLQREHGQRKMLEAAHSEGAPRSSDDERYALLDPVGDDADALRCISLGIDIEAGGDEFEFEGWRERLIPADDEHAELLASSPEHRAIALECAFIEAMIEDYGLTPDEAMRMMTDGDITLSDLQTVFDLSRVLRQESDEPLTPSEIRMQRIEGYRDGIELGEWNTIEEIDDPQLVLKQDTLTDTPSHRKLVWNPTLLAPQPVATEPAERTDEDEADADALLDSIGEKVAMADYCHMCDEMGIACECGNWKSPESSPFDRTYSASKKGDEWRQYRGEGETKSRQSRWRRGPPSLGGDGPPLEISLGPTLDDYRLGIAQPVRNPLVVENIKAYAVGKGEKSPPLMLGEDEWKLLGPDVIAVDDYLSRFRIYDGEKSMAENLRAIGGQEAVDYIDRLFAISKAFDRKQLPSEDEVKARIGRWGGRAEIRSWKGEEMRVSPDALRIHGITDPTWTDDEPPLPINVDQWNFLGMTKTPFGLVRSKPLRGKPYDFYDIDQLPRGSMVVVSPVIAPSGDQWIIERMGVYMIPPDADALRKVWAAVPDEPAVKDLSERMDTRRVDTR